MVKRAGKMDRGAIDWTRWPIIGSEDQDYRQRGREYCYSGQEKGQMRP